VAAARAEAPRKAVLEAVKAEPEVPGLAAARPEVEEPRAAVVVALAGAPVDRVAVHRIIQFR
jgi:hypothetical protein